MQKHRKFGYVWKSEKMYPYNLMIYVLTPSVIEGKQFIKVIYNLSFKSSNLVFLLFLFFIPYLIVAYIFIEKPLENQFSQYLLSKNTKNILIKRKPIDSWKVNKTYCM